MLILYHKIHMDPDKFLNYNSSLLDYAKDHRKNATKAEWIFWHVILKKKQFLWYKFRRQKVIWSFILDFYCSKLFLWIEIDGWYHNDVQDYDDERSIWLNSKYWIKTVRFTNEEIENNMEWVVLYLEDIIRDREKDLWL